MKTKLVPGKQDHCHGKSRLFREKQTFLAINMVSQGTLINIGHNERQSPLLIKPAFQKSRLYLGALRRPIFVYDQLYSISLKEDE